MNNEKEVQHFYLRNNPTNGLTYMASGQPPILGGTLYVLAADYDTLRRQLAELQAHATMHDDQIYRFVNRYEEAESKLALAEQDARRWSLFSKWWFRYWKDGNWEDAISAAKTPKELVDAIDAAIAAGEVAGGS